MFESSPKSICILRLSAIGDVCHAVSTVQAIQRCYPEASITWIIGKVEAALLAGLPGVEFVIFDKKQGKQAYKQLMQDMKGRLFDVLLHMQVAFRANLAAHFIPARTKLGFDKARSKELHSVFINQRIKAQTAPHVLDGFRAFASAIGVPESAPSWQMPLSDDDISFAQQVIPNHKPTLIISPAASKAERNWLPERYAAVAEYASSKGFDVLLCGGPAKLDRALGDDILRHAQCNITDYIGKTSLKQMLALLGRASLVLAPDTGPAHMAVTQGTPVIGLYAHSNPDRTGPYHYRDYVCEVYFKNLQTLTGKTAEQHKPGKRIKGAELMAQIDVEQVIQTFDRAVNELQLGANESLD
ncbi:glycosyltransferase family 9 protein [Flocculibacter collagenilyticus]|uniref:glycosyltransferase family 9 protein n=1 Tax=Flocculibacter collagenilyticus TaxID=2744479 RepID=UPI0018F380C3|nr:glycosyltransferase family 9 protein [Flocculibacter collagenilyticus]